MKIKIAAIFLLMLGFITCSKDTYNTKPTLKFESINATVFPQNSQVTFTLQCTDKEGDIVDTIWIQRVTRVPACSAIALTDSFPIPNFDPTRNTKADFIFTYNYPASQTGGASLQACSDNNSISIPDTCHFRFWMKDNAKHYSDTVQSPDIILLQQ